MKHILLLIAKYSYIGIFIGLALGILGLPIPDETLLTFSGFLCSQGKIRYEYALLIAFLGTSVGITIGYSLGKRLGYPFLEKYASKIHVNLEHLHNAEEWYKKYGKFALPLGYFVPGVRHLTAVFAGLSLMPYREFAFYAYSGGLLWTATFVTLGYYLGEKWHFVLRYLHHYMGIITIVIIIAACSILLIKSRIKK